jgi:hypothetical protein
MNKCKIYISGKISDIPEEEYKKKFKQAELEIKEMHDEYDLPYECVNPCNLPHKPESTWEECMLLDIQHLFTCDSIYMLTDWKDSRGARIEHAIAIEKRMVILYQQSS